MEGATGSWCREMGTMRETMGSSPKTYGPITWWDGAVPFGT